MLCFNSLWLVAPLKLLGHTGRLGSTFVPTPSCWVLGDVTMGEHLKHPEPSNFCFQLAVLWVILLESFQVMPLQKWHETKQNFFDFSTQRSAGSWRFLLEDLPRWTSVLGLIFCEGVALLALSRSSATSTNLDRTITIPAYTQSTRPFSHNRKNSTASTAHASSCLYFFGWVALRQNF